MNKQELVDVYSGLTEISKKDAEKQVNSFFESISKILVRDGYLKIMGFGLFKTKKNPERTGRNPQTGEKITINASNTVTFKVAQKIKDALNPKVEEVEIPEDTKKKKKKKWFEFYIIYIIFKIHINLVKFYISNTLWRVIFIFTLVCNIINRR